MFLSRELCITCKIYGGGPSLKPCFYYIKRWSSHFVIYIYVSLWRFLIPSPMAQSIPSSLPSSSLFDGFSIPKDAIYLRVSTKTQFDGGGIDVQKMKVKSSGVVGVEFIEQESGAKDNRPELKRAFMLLALPRPSKRIDTSFRSTFCTRMTGPVIDFRSRSIVPLPMARSSSPLKPLGFPSRKSFSWPSPLVNSTRTLPR